MRIETIGNATLYLGDCLEILPTLGKVDAVITDPPYGINTKSDGMGKLSPWGDLINSALWYVAWQRECKRLIEGPLKDGSGCMWSFMNWRSLVTFQKAAMDQGWSIESLLVWDKQWIGPGGTTGLRPSYELVALYAVGGFSIQDRGLPDIQRWKWSSIKPNGHPAEKPIEGMEWLIKHSTAPGGIVLDPFMGSGTCGAAAQGMERGFIGIEQDANWFDIACRRIDDAQRQQRLFA